MTVEYLLKYTGHINNTMQVSHILSKVFTDLINQVTLFAV